MPFGQAAFGELPLRYLCIVTMHRPPRFARLMNIFRLDAGRDILSNALELDMDAVTLAVSVSTHFLLDRHWHLVGAVTLAHWLPPASWLPHGGFGCLHSRT
jgi:hypothetical protein